MGLYQGFGLSFVKITMIIKIEHVTGHGQRPDRGGGDHHQPHHHSVLLPPLRGLRVVPGPLQQQHGGSTFAGYAFLEFQKRANVKYSCLLGLGINLLLPFSQFNFIHSQQH